MIIAKWYLGGGESERVHVCEEERKEKRGFI